MNPQPINRADDRSGAVLRAQGGFDAYAMTALWLVVLYVALTIAGVNVFGNAAVMMGGNRMRPARALFTAVNAATLTGFRQSIALEQVLRPGQICAFVLMLCGTFCVMSAAALGVVKLLGLRWSIARVLLSAALMQIATTLLGGGALYSLTRDFFFAMFQAASAFGNCGLTLGPTADSRHWLTYAVLLPLAMLGGIGLPVILDVVGAVFGARALTKHSRVTIAASAIALLAGFALCALLALPPEKPLSALRPALASGLVAAINTRSAGLPVDPVYVHPRAMQWMMIVLMAIGAGSAGAAGGLKVTTVYVLFRGARRALAGEGAGRLFGIAFVCLVSFFALVLIALLCFLQNQPQIPGDRALFIVVSAAANVGLSHDPLSVTPENSHILCATMTLGRLLPIAIIWWAALTVSDADVAVG